MRRWPAVVVLLLLNGSSASPAASDAPDPEEVERQYRIARRLASEGSAEASRALRRVVELDPAGPRADDALVELARLAGIAGWPEQVGRVDTRSAVGALSLLDQLLAHLPEGDRVEEARYLRGLLLLEPIEEYRPAEARVELVAVATHRGDSAWSGAARHTLAWIYEREGRDDAAFAAYHRVLVDHPGSRAATRSRVGLARLLLRLGRAADAASSLQQAVEAGAADETLARPLRERAVRELDLAGAAVPWRTATGVRAPDAFVAGVDGSVVLARRRDDRVLRLEPGGRNAEEWTVEGLHAVAVDRAGRPWAAAGEAVYLLREGGRAERRGGLGELVAPSSIAVDEECGVWLLDRRGQQIARLAPGSASPTPIWQGEQTRLTAVAWDGRRLVGLDSRAGRVLAIDASGETRTLLESGLDKPIALAADRTGRIGVLDSRTGFVTLLGRPGTLMEAYAYPADGIRKPVGLALALDGTLHLFDDADGSWVGVP